MGFAFGVPTLMLLIQNGAMLGAILALYISRGLGLEMGGWLIIHGSTEMFAIILAGAAGLQDRLGRRLPRRGEQARRGDAGRADLGAGHGGVVAMLACAGLLEGVGRQIIISDMVRYAIGLTMLALWLAYFYLPRRADV